MNLDWVVHEPEEVYHEQSKSGKYMSSHLLADFRKSPELYHKKVLGQIEEAPSTALSLGTAAHKLILEGREAFDKEYTIADGPINEKTGEPYGKATKAYASWLAQQEKAIISTDDFGQITKLYQSVHRHHAAADLLDFGQAECVGRSNLYGVPCQIRMDWFNPDKGLVDLKTTAELQYFEYDCKRFGYIHQMAFYRAVIHHLTGVWVPVHIIAVEKVEPFAAGVWLLTPEVLDQAEFTCRAALERYKECVKTGVWPTGYETVRVIGEL